jgi:hypothetical protein
MFSASSLADILEAIPEYALLLDSEGLILAANKRLLREFDLQPEELAGKAPGDILCCIFRHEGDGGCMSGSHCRICGAKTAFSECLERHDTVTREYLVLSDRQGITSFDLEVTTTPLTLGEESFMVCTLKDNSSEHRRAVLERTFFHDVMNMVTGICSLATLLSDDSELTRETRAEYVGWLSGLSQRLADEFHHHRRLLAAEKGLFKPEMGTVEVLPLMEEVLAICSNHPAAQERRLRLGATHDHAIVSDARIVRRILINLVINALEAVPAGATVTLHCTAEGERTTFSVHNPGVMTEEVQLQLFRRSFSTKSQEGRGIGTYSIKLFGERYLKGKVDFTSREPEGTTFFFTLENSGASVMAGEARGNTQ